MYVCSYFSIFFENGELVFTFVIFFLYFSLDVLRENIVLSLNEEYINVSDSQVLTLNSGDTVAVIPPISGG